VTPSPRHDRRIDAVVIGGGQAGLATSRELSLLGIRHVVLERGEVANAWRTERWDSLHLLTPNWQCRLPGYAYAGGDPDGYLAAREVAGLLDNYAAACAAPLHTQTRVIAVRAARGGYRVRTDRGDWRCRALVLASGPYNLPRVPALAAALPRQVLQLAAQQYRNPAQLPDGGVLVVGAAATGVQLAQELAQAGRAVTLAVGEHVRMPRCYRGRDIQYWLEVTGVLDQGPEAVDDVERVRSLPSPQLVGDPRRIDVDLNALAAQGVELVGRVAGLAGSCPQFSGSLANVTRLADLKQQRLLRDIDAWVDAHGGGLAPPVRPAPTRTPPRPRLQVDLAAREFQTVLWATGLRPDYSWLQVPVLDGKGYLRHDGGVTPAPGLYAVGLPFQRRRRSGFICGVGDDARHIAGQLAQYLGSARGDRGMAAA